MSLSKSDATLQRFIEGKNKPPYKYKVFDYENIQREPGYYFIMTRYGWELIYWTIEGHMRHMPYFNYQPTLKITERIPDAAGKNHEIQQLALYEHGWIGEALRIKSPAKLKLLNLIKNIQ